MRSSRVAAHSQTSSPKRGLGFWLLVVAGGAIALALLAPGIVGRLLGQLWVSVMGVVMGLIASLIGGS